MSPLVPRPAFEKSYPLSAGWFRWWPPVAVSIVFLVLAMFVPYLLLVLPVVLLISLVPAWILSGRLHVRAEPGCVRLTRSRWTWKIEKALTFPPTEAPEVQATRPWGHKPHGILTVRASTGSREVRHALHAALAPVASDLDAYFRPTSQSPAE